MVFGSRVTAFLFHIQNYKPNFSETEQVFLSLAAVCVPVERIKDKRLIRIVVARYNHTSAIAMSVHHLARPLSTIRQIW
jgi:hypothetical protein